jgi:RNA polymerase sigma factor (sigma-70 family)
VLRRRPERRVERLYRDHARSLYGFLAYRTGDRHAAEDLLADVFERVLRSGDSFDARKGSETAWLYAIALNLVRDERRRAEVHGRAMEREAREQHPEGAPAPDEHPLAAELAIALTKLSRDEHDVIALRFGADLRIEQVAQALGEPVTTVEGRLYRGLRKLRRVMTSAPTATTS